MPPLKKAIFQEIRKRFDGKLDSVSDEQMNSLIFHHPGGLRLSLNGFIQLKAIFTAYSFEIPPTLKSRHNFGMSKMEYPYFLTRKRLVLFSEMDAMVIKLHGGIEGFLETCSQID
jgi:hypothetical protein